MQVITETEERTTVTPSARMAGLAGPSQGSTELSTWRVRMDPGTSSPAHVIDREQVWMTLSGVFEFTVDQAAVQVAPGQAIVLPAGADRRFRAVDQEAEALVAMPSGGKASTSGGESWVPIPWAA